MVKFLSHVPSAEERKYPFSRQSFCAQKKLWRESSCLKAGVRSAKP